MRVAFVGLGNMGAQQARCLAAAGHALALFDQHPASLEEFAGFARLASSAADAAKDAEIAGICVRDDDQAADVVAGPDGVLRSLPPGSVILLHSTVRISTVQDLAARAASCGVHLLDAPVSRVTPDAQARFVITMTGGDSQARDAALPVIEAFSTRSLHVGPTGSAMALKTCNNLVTWVQLVIGCIAADIAKQTMVPNGLLEQVMSENGNLTPSMSQLLGARAAFTPGQNAGFEALMASQAGIGEKDIALASDLGRSLGLDMSLSEAVLAQLRAIMTRGQG